MKNYSHKNDPLVTFARVALCKKGIADEFLATRIYEEVTGDWNNFVLFTPPDGRKWLYFFPFSCGISAFEEALSFSENIRIDQIKAQFM
jgi:hypothetical protein